MILTDRAMTDCARHSDHTTRQACVYWAEIVFFQTFDVGLGMPVILWKWSIYQKLPLRRGRIGGGKGHWFLV